MRTNMVVGVAAIAVLAGPLSAWQVPAAPAPPPKSVHGECYRPDVQQNEALMQKAMAAGTEVSQKDMDQARNKVAGCTFYQITLAATMLIEDTETPGVTSTIKGKGSITLGLNQDDGMAGYDFTSGVQDLTAPIYWEKGSALITRPDCIVTTVELPYTLFAFWLGVSNAPSLKVGVRIAPDGNENHSIATRCKDQTGAWHDGLPGEKESIFSPAWLALHGEGKNVVAPSADAQAANQFLNDLGKDRQKPGDKPKPNKAYQTPAMPKIASPTGAMDAGKLQALQDYMTKHPNASPAEVMKQMSGVAPDLDQQLAAAEDNFMFTAPGDCAPVNAVEVVCALPGQAVTLSSRMGFGTIKKITESAVITIEKVSPPPGSP